MNKQLKSVGERVSTKERLLETALELFAREGFENTGVAQIVQSAGVTKPTLYHHYGNKDGLLQSIIAHYGKALKEVLGCALVYEGDVIGSMDRLVISYIGFAKKNPVFFRLYKQLYQSPQASDSYRIICPFYEDVLEEVEVFFTKIGGYHTNLQGKISWMSFSLLGLMDTYILHHLQRNELEDLDDNRCRQVAKQFLYGVFS